jgi:hypothetical protein
LREREPATALASSKRLAAGGSPHFVFQLSFIFLSVQLRFQLAIGRTPLPSAIEFKLCHWTAK